MASAGRWALVTVNTDLEDHRPDARPRPRGGDRPRLVRGAAGRARWRCATGCIDAPFYRLVHAEADGLPGVVIDRFGDAAVIQPNAAWAEAHLDDLVAALVAVTGVLDGGQERHGPGARRWKGWPRKRWCCGARSPGRCAVPMNGAIYMADLTGRAEDRAVLRPAAEPRLCRAAGQGRAGAGRVCPCRRLCAGGAGGGGADRRWRSMPRRRRWRWPRQGAAASGMADRFATRQGDAFAVLEALAAEGAQFDLVICDPPAFAPPKPALEAGLRAYERVARLAAPLVAPGGYLVLCSCSHAADLAAFRNASARGIGRARAAGAADPYRLCRAGPSDAAATGRKRLSQGAGLPAGRMKAVLDACVLYPTVLREILHRAWRRRGCYRPLWSDRILRGMGARDGQARPRRRSGGARRDRGAARAAFPRRLVREPAGARGAALAARRRMTSMCWPPPSPAVPMRSSPSTPPIFPRHLLAEEGIAAARSRRLPARDLAGRPDPGGGADRGGAGRGRTAVGRGAAAAGAFEAGRAAKVGQGAGVGLMPGIVGEINIA